jgi:hypothetical protein
VAQKDLVTREKMSHSGVFSFGSFYGFMHGWLKEEGYGVTEEKYGEKIGGDTRDVSAEWKATKDLTEYFRIELKMKIEVKGLADVEVEIDGDKKQMQKGGVELDIQGFLIRDPSSEWDKKPGLRFLRDVYNKYIIPKRVDDMKDMTTKLVQDMKEEIKAFLELSGRR